MAATGWEACRVGMAGAMTVYSTSTGRGSFAGPFGSVTRLALICTSSESVCTLALRGDLDVDSVIALQTQFDQLASEHFKEIVLDTSGLLRPDATGKATLGRLRERALATGAALRSVGRAILEDPDERTGDG